MKSDLKKLFEKMKQRGVSADKEERMRLELNDTGSHDLSGPSEVPDHAGVDSLSKVRKTVYSFRDLVDLQGMSALQATYNVAIRSIDELLERDKQRERDGFPKKINVGRLIKPGKGGKEKIVVVPTTVEEKFIHDPNVTPPEEGDPSGGSGDGEEGEVIGEQPIHDPDASGEGPGQGEGGVHEIESNAYDLGKILTEQFELPNLKDKGKKKSLTRYTYDMTDKNRGFGQLLDKKATLRKIVETNIHLGNLPDVSDIDPTRFLVSPGDRIFRVLSREKDYESQAVVFFLRDYSGSMAGKATTLVATQHVLIYSWLLYQYSMQVETRFILHDTEAKEVPDFYTYYNSKVAGGTQVSSAYRLMNEIVETENLARDYNIYAFHGTDGDDWDTTGKEAIPELTKMLTYANRVGITIAEHGYGARNNTEVEKYIKKSGLLKEKSSLLRMDVMQENATESRLIEGIKHLISE